MDKKPVASTVDEYIARFSVETAIKLQKIRATIRHAAPEANEGISYHIPVYTFHGPVVYFAAYARHIGFYPTSSGIEHFREELSPYKTSRGTVQFPLNKEIPYELIARITEFRMQENRKKKR